MKNFEKIEFLYGINESGEIVIKDKLEPIRVIDFDELGYTHFLDQYQKNINSGADFMPIIIDSYGGEVHVLLGMLNYLEEAKQQGIKIITSCSTKAMSCGAVLLSFGSKGYRYMAPHSYLMIHEVSGVEFGKLSDVKSGVKHTEELNSLIFTLLDKNAEKEPGFFSSLIKENKNADLFLSSEECLKYGLIDFIGIPSIEMNLRPIYKFHGSQEKNKNNQISA